MAVFLLNGEIRTSPAMRMPDRRRIASGPAPRRMRQRPSKAKLMVMKVCLADLNATTSCHTLLCDESIERHQSVPGIYDERIRFHPPCEYQRLRTHPMPSHIEPLAR